MSYRLKMIPSIKSKSNVELQIVELIGDIDVVIKPKASLVIHQMWDNPFMVLEMMISTH